jgi:hypothetical protein
LEGNIKMYLNEMEFDIVEWIEMAQNRIGWCAGVNYGGGSLGPRKC